MFCRDVLQDETHRGRSAVLHQRGARRPPRGDRRHGGARLRRAAARRSRRPADALRYRLRRGQRHGGAVARIRICAAPPSRRRTGRSVIRRRRRCSTAPRGPAARCRRSGRTASAIGDERAAGQERRRRFGALAAMAQVGRAIPRREARAKVTGRAEYVHNLRLPGMLYGKIFRSTVAARPHPQHRHERGAERSPASTASSPARTSARSSRTRTTARRSTTSRSWRSTRCAMSASRSRWCSPRDPHVAEQAVQLIEAEYEELPAVYDEVEAMTSKVDRARELKPAGTFADLKHCGPHGHQRRARLSAAARRRGRRVRARPITCSSTRSAPSR